MIMCIQNLIKFCPLVLKILSGNEIRTSIKGYNSVANVQKSVLYNPNPDVINVNVHTNFGYSLYIDSQDIERNEILTSIKGRNFAANLRKMTVYNPNLDLVNVNVYTKFG